MGKNNRFKNNFTNPVIEMICGNLYRFGLDVKAYGTRADHNKSEVYNYIYTDHSMIKMVPNFAGTAFTSMINTSLLCENDCEIRLRIDEFIKVYIAVLFIHTILTDEDIESIKNGIPYCKNGIKSVMDRKEDSLYVTIFDFNNRRTDNLLPNNT